MPRAGAIADLRFNEAAPIKARKGRTSAPPPRSRSGFNEAAPIKARKEHLAWDGLVLRYDASMRPRRLRRGRALIIFFAFAVCLLQ